MNRNVPESTSIQRASPLKLLIPFTASPPKRTAADFANYKIPIAAKTGTAENIGSDHTTFICFAPYDNPKYAISVVIEHGASGKWSKNVARDILDACFAS